MNCQRVQSLLSAYLDGELTGEEMILIRNHMTRCNYCTDEFNSLKVVKRLLGSMQAANANEEWVSTISTYAYAGNRPWWEKQIVAESFIQRFGRPGDAGELTPRGTRMVRALALSAVFVFLAAGPFSTRERIDQGVTGRMAGSLGLPSLSWTADRQIGFQPISTIFQSMDSSRETALSTAAYSQPGYSNEWVAAMPSDFSTPFSGSGGLTFVSDSGK